MPSWSISYVHRPPGTKVEYEKEIRKVATFGSVGGSSRSLRSVLFTLLYQIHFTLYLVYLLNLASRFEGQTLTCRRSNPSSTSTRTSSRQTSSRRSLMFSSSFPASDGRAYGRKCESESRSLLETEHQLTYDLSTSAPPRLTIFVYFCRSHPQRRQIHPPPCSSCHPPPFRVASPRAHRRPVRRSRLRRRVRAFGAAGRGHLERVG